MLIFGSTGIAALEVKGMTVHRFFGIKPESFPDAGRMRDEYIEAMYHSDTIIIDEGPMLRADIIDALNETMQNNLDNPGPFGRKRIIFV